MRLLLLLTLGCLAVIAQFPVSSDPPQAPVPAVKPDEKCSVEGTVLNTATAEALKKVRVVARALGGNNNGVSAISDAAGHFKIEGIDSGRYTLMANRTGFVNQIYGAKGPNRSGTTLTLMPGQSMKDIAFKLTAHGVVTGRVLDEDGDPLANVTLQCQRFLYAQGKKQLMPAAVRNTNDLGEYRFFGLAPGKYYVSAQYDAPEFNPQVITPRKDYEEGYAPVYYPDSLTVEAATALDVTAGVPVRGIDLKLTKTRAVRVRGQVINGVSNKPSRNTNVSLVVRNSMWIMELNLAPGVDSKGHFELHNVVPGSYFVIARIFEDNRESLSKLPIDVGTTNIDGVRVVVNPAVDVSGRVIVEGAANSRDNIFHVSLESKNPSPLGDGGGGPANEDGTFTIKNVQSDIYLVNLYGLRDNLYLKAVRFGDDDVTDSGVDFTQGVTPGEFTVIVSAAGGQVDGTVQNVKSEPVAGAMVVLIPAPEKRGINRLYKNATSDQNGNFSLKGIAPGEYKLFAWEQVEYGAYQDPGFLKAYDSKGESVTIQENTHENKHLQLIPAEETEAPPSR